MDLRQLKTFHLAATTLSFTQTAVLLDYAQSSVSTQIQALERELNVPLFDRLGRTIQLTESGKQLLPYAETLLRLAEEAQTAVSGNLQVSGTLRIGAPETLCTYRLPAVLREFRRQYPQVQLAFRPMLDQEIYQQVQDGQLDVGFLLQEPLSAVSIQTEALVEEQLVVFCALDHPLAQREMVTTADLKGETILITETGCGYRHLFEHMLSQAGVYAVIKLDFNSIEAIKQCVMAGLGIGFLPRVVVASQIEQGQIHILPLSPVPQICTQMIWHKEKWLSPLYTKFLQLCRQMMSA